MGDEPKLQKRAVVVGINKYRDPDITTELKGAENDAREVFARLKHFGGFQLDPEKHLLIGEKATSDKVRRAISELFWKKDHYDVALFYFSGHGFLDDYGNGYIAPYDHEYEDPMVAGIRMQELREYFLGATNKSQALLILDCCHSGVSAQDGKGAVPMSGPFYDPLKKDLQLAGMLGDGKFILASSGADEQSREMCQAHKIRIFDQKLRQEEKLPDDLESHDHGIMTYYLLQGMDGAAGEGGAVRIGSLFDYVAQEVRKLDQKYNNRKTFDCVAMTYAEGSASKAVLVTASNKSRIDDCVQQARNKMKDIYTLKDTGLALAPSNAVPGAVVFPGSLLDAVVYADQALQLSPAYPEAIAVVGDINSKLSEYTSYVFRWLAYKSGEYGAPESRDEFDKLSGVVSNLCFDMLSPLDQGQRSLVKELILLCLDIGNEARFKGVLNVKPFTRSGGGLATSVSAGRPRL